MVLEIPCGQQDCAVSHQVLLDHPCCTYAQLYVMLAGWVEQPCSPFGVVPAVV